MMSLHSYCTIGAIAVLTACGGASRPGPLQHHLDDMYIARVPIDQKRTVLDAQQEWQLAKLAWQEAQQNYESANTDVRVAENERKKAKLEEESVKEKQKAAEKTGDLTQINANTLLMRAAKLSHKAAAKKVEYMKARRQQMLVLIDYAEDIMYAREAAYELDKARTAQKNNIQPRGFAPNDFQTQAEKRSRYAQRSKSTVDQEKAKVERTKKEWKALEKEAQAAQRSADDALGNSIAGSSNPDTSSAGSTGSSGTGTGNSGTTTEPAKPAGGGQ